MSKTDLLGTRLSLLNNRVYLLEQSEKIKDSVSNIVQQIKERDGLEDCASQPHQKCSDDYNPTSQMWSHHCESACKDRTVWDQERKRKLYCCPDGWFKSLGVRLNAPYNMSPPTDFQAYGVLQNKP